MGHETLPYSPRPLTRKELTELDIYLLRSPKAKREVVVSAPLRLAFWLKHEFDPETTAMVERPRTLRLADDREIELDFWVRSKDSREPFWVAVSVEDTVSSGGQRVSRTLPEWTRAAQRAGIELAFIYEHEWERRASAFGNHLLLLPHVQAFEGHPRGAHAIACVRESFGPGVLSLSFKQLTQMLPGLEPGLARMAASALIHQGWLSFESHTRLSQLTRLTRREVV